MVGWEEGTEDTYSHSHAYDTHLKLHTLTPARHARKHTRFAHTYALSRAYTRTDERAREHTHTGPTLTLRYAGNFATDIVVAGAKGAHTCALLNGGRIMCWGDNSKGQLGTGSMKANIPQLVPITCSGLTPCQVMITAMQVMVSLIVFSSILARQCSACNVYASKRS